MRYYFLGICGTAMASLAVLLKQKGHQVWGTDQNIYPPMSKYLHHYNIPITLGYHSRNLSVPFDKAVIGNALSRGNPEVETILNQRLPFVSMPELIRQEFIEKGTNIVITGTHGKTTTTALISWLLHQSNLEPTFLVGGIAKNFSASVSLGKGNYFIIEGDEYDSAFFDKRAKFLHYFPCNLVINNIEYDHSDIYHNLKQIKDEFRKLIKLVPKNGLIVANGDDPHVREILKPVYSPVIFYGKEPHNHWSFENVSSFREGMRFDLREHSNYLGNFFLPLYGEYQIYNSLAAIIIVSQIGLTNEQIQAGLNSFQNVKRRLEFIGFFNGAPFYDDFAHHHTAIDQSLRAIKQKHPNSRVVVIFEPRTNTTVKNIFQNETAKALSNADIILIAPIHRPDRIKHTKRLSLPQLARDIQLNGKVAHVAENYEDIQPILKKIVNPQDTVVLMTNGNLGGTYSGLLAKINMKK
jgi:UDP-N-acetylmuramate: L-alanyl-gamma-D-glutamyl-meso-diaminopimelate ligase